MLRSPKLTAVRTGLPTMYGLSRHHAGPRDERLSGDNPVGGGVGQQHHATAGEGSFGTSGFQSGRIGKNSAAGVTVKS
jgi:hypothetical protein